MNTFKITNITHTLGKRDINYNMTLNVDYNDNMMKKTIELKPSGVLYLTVKSLPVSLHKFRIKGLISVIEISDKELKSEIAEDKKQKESNVVSFESMKKKEKTTTTTTTTKKQTRSTKSKSTSTKSTNKSSTTEKTINMVSSSDDD
ncbi:MAG: hypothetical protein ACOC33_03885 [bacterium]